MKWRREPAGFRRPLSEPRPNDTESIDALRQQYVALCRSVGAPGHLDPYSRPEDEDRLRLMEEVKTAVLGERYGSSSDLGRIPGVEHFSRDTVLGLSMIQGLGRELDVAMTRLEMCIAIPYFAGSLPTGSFNAQSIRVKGGVLMLVNFGLLSLVYQIVKILSWSWRADTASNGKVTLTFRPDRVLPTTRAQQIAALRRVLSAYLLFGSPAKAPRYPALGGPAGSVATALVHHCEKFALAHEYGHAISGHLDRSRISRGRLSRRFISKTVEQEFEADRIGTMLVLAPTAAPRARRCLERWEAMAIVAAPLVVFAIDGALTALHRRTKGGVPFVQDHPSSHERAARIRSGPIRDFGVPNDALTMADAYVSYLQLLVLETDDLPTDWHDGSGPPEFVTLPESLSQ